MFREPNLRRIVVVVLASLLLAVPFVLGNTDGIVLFRTYRRVYDSDDSIEGVLANLSRHVIDVRFSEPLIYELSSYGWLPPFFVSTFVYYPNPHEARLVQPGGVLPMNLSFVHLKVEHLRWILLEEQYIYNGEEYVVYSNSLVTDDSGQPPILRTPPAGLTEVPAIRTDVIGPYVVSVANGATNVVWFNPACSTVDLDDYTADYPLFATLQRKTSEGTWQVFRPDTSDCETNAEPIRIGPGETVQLILEDGYPPSNTLEPGEYRWNLVLFVSPFPQCRFSCELQGAHLFTESFEP